MKRDAKREKIVKETEAAMLPIEARLLSYRRWTRIVPDRMVHCYTRAEYIEFEIRNRRPYPEYFRACATCAKLISECIYVGGDGKETFGREGQVILKPAGI